MVHSDDDIEDVPVLVVGAGPAGLAAAIELTRRAVTVLVVERRTALSAHPRATVLSLRSMEHMRSWGLEAEVRAHSADVDMRMLYAETLADAAAGEAVEVGYPIREQSRVLSPVEPACVAQDDVEPLLLAHLRAQPSARVELGMEVTGVRVRSDGARATLRDVRTGAVRTVQARYVVGADGARSVVRRALGVAMPGDEDVLVGFTTLFRAPLWDVVGPHRFLLYAVTQRTSPITFLPAGPSDRWLAGLRMDGADTFDERRIAETIRAGAGVPGLPVRIERSRRFSAAVQLAERFRAGPVFLAGDAAHRVTPRGGSGLNIALHDGVDLGWKLAWVLRAWASPALLDTYEDERRPVAAYTAARSADPNGSIRPTEQILPADLGGRIPHVWSDAVSTLDLLGSGLTLFAGHDGVAWEAATAAPTTRVPVTVRRLDPIAARAVGAAGRSALLVRPDGRPAAVLPPGDEPARALRAAVAAATAGVSGTEPPWERERRMRPMVTAA